MILPLLWGEGWGEGERSARKPHRILMETEFPDSSVFAEIVNGSASMFLAINIGDDQIQAAH
jgi:hypothetical protein